MQDFNKENHQKSGDLTKSIHPAYHFKLSARDMARIGQLMLNKGVWNGKQLVQREWVEKSTKLVTHVYDMIEKRQLGMFGYGYLWWIYDTENKNDSLYGSYKASGTGGQHIYIIPKLNTILIHKKFPDLPGNGYDPDVQTTIKMSEIVNYISSAYID